MRYLKRLAVCICFLTIFFGFPQLYSQDKIQLQNDLFDLQFDGRGLSSIILPSDTFLANGLEQGRRFGDIEVVYKIGEGDWLNTYTGGRMRSVDSINRSVSYDDFQTGMPISMTQVYKLEDTYLDWELHVETKMEFPVKIGDLMIPFPWNKPNDNHQIDIFERSFIKHHFISGDASFLYFTKPSGNPPYLLITTKPGTQLEYFTSDRESGYRMYVCSGLSGTKEQRGTWRQEHTCIDLPADNFDGNGRTLGLRFHWASSYNEMREILVQEGLFDIRVVPGMTLPSDLTAKFSLHSTNIIDSIVSEYPEQTELSYIGEAVDDHQLYEVIFKRLGENMLTVYYNGNEKTYLEFFSTEPLETLIKKRSSFITGQQQHRDSSLWYDGLYSIYDMKNSILRGPDNTDGYDHWWGYVLSCDDPGLCKAPYVAAKNVWYPDDEEIRSVEYYIENFVWGGLQRTDEEEPYPYGIYGVPNWKTSRDPEGRAGTGSYNLDKMKIWRSYDYPHIFMLYYHMYQIAKFYPDKVKYLDEEAYLERAYQTAKAYWTYPYEILPWYETYKIGCYNELVLLDIIDALEEKGYTEKANFLRDEWEKKVKYFVYDDPYPYGSEYSLDRTAFESSYALAKYGTQTEMKPDSKLWFDKNLDKWYTHSSVSRSDSRQFMDQQYHAGLSVRGWLEPKYFLLGSDWTTSSDGSCLSYMAKMGGWSILDYGLNYVDKPWDCLQLGYASYLSSWALMNTGTEASDYGYWYPGIENDGAMGWAFMAAKYGRAWNRKDEARGAWRYDGEADLGLGATFRMAQTILAEDPLFGWISYGGLLTQSKKGFSVIPRDGVRNKFSLVSEKIKLLLILDRDCFEKDQPVLISKSLDKISFSISNVSGNDHELNLEIHDHCGVLTEIIHNGKKVPFTMEDNATIKVKLNISGQNNRIDLRL